jgi:hypothetical protein
VAWLCEECATDAALVRWFADRVGRYYPWALIESPGAPGEGPFATLPAEPVGPIQTARSAWQAVAINGNIRKGPPPIAEVAKKAEVRYCEHAPRARGQSHAALLRPRHRAQHDHAVRARSARRGLMAAADDRGAVNAEGTDSSQAQNDTTVGVWPPTYQCVILNVVKNPSLPTLPPP